MTRSSSRLLGAVAVMALAACAPAVGAYFPQPAPTTITGSARVGERALVGVVDLAAAPGDRVELVAATPVGLQGGAHLAAWVIRRDVIGGGGIGFATEGELPPALDFDAVARPLGSFAFASTDGPIQVVLALESSDAGTATFDGVRVSFRIGGMERAETFPTAATITFDSS